MLKNIDHYVYIDYSNAMRFYSIITTSDPDFIILRYECKKPSWELSDIWGAVKTFMLWDLKRNKETWSFTTQEGDIYVGHIHGN